MGHKTTADSESQDTTSSPGYGLGPLDLERGVDTHTAGKILGLNEVTLAQQRMRGEGPPFFRIGRTIRYRLGTLLAYRDACTVGKR